MIPMSFLILLWNILRFVYWCWNLFLISAYLSKSFLNYRNRQLFFPIFKICLHSGNYILIFIFLSHVWAFKLPAAANRVVFKPAVWFFTAAIPWKWKDRNIVSKISIIRTMKTLKFDPFKTAVATVFTLQIQFQYMSIVIGFPEMFMYSWLAALLCVCVCVCVCVCGGWSLVSSINGYRNPWKDNTEVLKIHMYVTRSHCMTIYALN